MIRNTVLFIATVTLLAAATGCDDDDVLTPPQTATVELSLDGNNFTAPNLQGATYVAAARFTNAQTAAAAGGELVEVQFYIRAMPDSCRVRVYGAGTATAPGAVLYEADVTANIVTNDWNSHVLQSPVGVSGDDLWIGVEFTHAVTQRVIGCDTGPAVPDGDWLYSSTDAMWLPFNQRFPASVNWNVRGIAEVTM